MEFAGCSNDGSFGPSVHGCRGEFDFTIKFEKIFFSLLPSPLLIAIAAPRLVALFKRPIVAGGTWYQFLKLAVILALAIIQIALIGIAAQAKRLASLFVASAVLDFLAMLTVAVTSFYEHSRSPRPSILLGVYLPLTVLFDIAQTRSMWLAAHNHSDLLFIKLFTTTTALRAFTALLESKNKRRWLVWNKEEHSPEEDSNVYSLATLSWLIVLLRTGYQKILTPADLLPLDAKLSVASLAKYTAKIRPEKFNHKKHALSRSLARTFAVQILQPVAGRIGFLGFSLCQPLLIQSLLTYLATPDSSANVGYGLIGATAIIFVGSPLSQALDNYYQHRFVVAVRATLISKIYQHTTQIPLNASDDSAALTLMSTDVERIRLGLVFLHNFWSVPVQVAISFWLLYRQLGAAFVAPAVVIIICIMVSVVTTKIIGRLQRAWMAKVQIRVGKTSNVVANMKNVKLSGLTEPIKEAIQDMRVNEIGAGNRFRGMDVAVSTFGFAPGQIAAMFTFIFTARHLDASIIFSSVAFLAILSNPLNLLIQCSPVFISALACLQRVQDFLEKEPRKDFRTFIDESTASEKAEAPPSGVALKITDASMGWEENKFAINDLSATITPGLNMVVGPVASGKSTLCKALLGETPSFKGEIMCYINARQSGFCDQVPFLLNSNIRQNIIGYLPFDEARYSEVINAAVLSPDLAILPYGDQTNIGSNGIALSGGQKQRISLARALYQDFELYIFDDILSGLDVDTEQKVFERVFGRNGLLKKRGAVAVLCTHSVRHLPDCDHILALSVDGELVEEGTFHELMANKKYIYSLGVQATSSDSSPSASTASPIEEVKKDDEANQPKSVTAPERSNNDANDATRKTGDIQVFVHYCRSIGLHWLILFTLSGIGLAFFWNFPNVWLKFWVADLGGVHHTRSYYVGIYALFACLSLVFVSLQMGIGMLIVAKVSGTALHKSALNTLCNAPLGFFTRTDAGVLVNLFSQDMTLIDDELPNAFVNTMEGSAIVIGGAVVAAISSPYVVIAYPFMLGIMYAVQRFYLRTSRQIRLLGLEAKTPLYTSFLDTIKGVATFRAFGWTEEAIRQNNGFLDGSQRPTYFQLMIQNWLIVLLNSLTGLLAIFIVILATQLKTNIGSVGAGMVSIILCGRFLVTCVKEYTILENSLGAVNRLKTFDEKTVSEHLKGEDVKPPPSWPEKGRVVLRNVSASYADDQATYESSSSETVANEKSSDENLALRDLSLTIEAGQKVAICGRTGSGKSSSILLLLRLLNPIRGSDFTMSIDDQPLDKVDRVVLRERVISVPQDPVFLPDGSSFLSNLDPSHKASEQECQDTLRAVDLWRYVEGKGGLEGGLNAEELSQGQKQLFSLARAILRRRLRARILSSDVGASYLESEKTATAVSVSSGNGGLLILDEYSSSLDIDTDRAMQAIIRREFEGYTIIMVSHRLEMVLGFDKVVVLDSGAVVEQGVPSELAEQDSRFRHLLLTGKTEQATAGSSSQEEGEEEES